METPPLAFAVLYVSDIAAASPFFEGALGLTPMPDLDLPEERQFAPGPHGAQLAVQPPHPGTTAGVVELHFASHDLAGLRAALVARGAAPSEIVEDEFSTAFTLPMPDGEPLTVDEVKSTTEMVEAKDDQRLGAEVPAPVDNTAVRTALAYVLLRVADFPAASAYFADTLGFTPDPTRDGPGFRQFAAAPGGISFAIIPATAEAAPGTAELYFTTPDVEATWETMRARGVAVGPLLHLDFGDVFAAPAVDGVPIWVWRP